MLVRVGRLIPLVAQKPIIAVKALTAKILAVALSILKAFSNLLYYIPTRLFNRNIQSSFNIQPSSFPNQEGMVLDHDLLGLVLTQVANAKLEQVSKGFNKASLQSYRLIFEELKEEPGCLSLIVEQAILDHPIEGTVEEVFKKRLKQVYSTVMANAKNWPDCTEIFAATYAYGPLNPKRLIKIARWTTDQHLIYLFKFIASQNLGQPIPILTSNLSTKAKACNLRQWLSDHPDAFDTIRILTLPGTDKKLTEIPLEISYLKNLQELNFCSHAIRFLPETVGQLTRLQILDLADNQLQALPNSFRNLTQLLWLNLANNRLQILPDSIRHLKQLQLISLIDNPLHGLPESLGNLIRIDNLYITDNQLQRLPTFRRQIVNLIVQIRKIKNFSKSILNRFITL